MADTQTNVLVAAYPDLDEAARDFDALMQIVNSKQVEIEGAILVTHDASGGVRVVQHGDHLGRKGLGWGAGAGLAVGPLAADLVGAALYPACTTGGPARELRRSSLEPIRLGSGASPLASPPGW